MSQVCPFCCAELIQAPAVVMEGVSGQKISFGYCMKCYSWVPEVKKPCLTASELARQVGYHEMEWSEGSDNAYLNAALGITKVIQEYKTFFGSTTDSFICDIGAGRGNFLKALIDLGYTAMGCEPSILLSERARAIYGLNETQLMNMPADQFIEHIQDVGKKFDVFVLWHVIEHIPGSLNLLEALLSVAREEFTIVLQTPLPVKRYIYDEHLFFPSIETYHYIAQKLGLEVKFLKYVPYNMFVTCILSNKPLKKLYVLPKGKVSSNLDAMGLHLDRLDQGAAELLTVIERQRQKISRFIN